MFTGNKQIDKSHIYIAVALVLLVAVWILACGAGGNPTLDDLEGRSMPVERGLTDPNYVEPIVEDGLEQGAGLANSSWPKFRKNVFNTGRSASITGPTTPKKYWQYDTGEEIGSSACIDEEGRIYFTARFKLLCIDKDASLIWEYSIGEDVWGALAIDHAGTIFLGSESGKFFAVKSDGTKRWEYDTGSFIETCPLISVDGNIFCGGNDGSAYSFLPNGVRRWRYIVAPGYRMTAAPALSKDMIEVYFACADGTVASINVGDGSLTWSYTAGAAVYSSPVVDADGNIMFGCDDGYLYKLSSEGELLWKSYVGGRLRSSLALNSDGNAVIGSEDGKIVMYQGNGNLLWEYATEGAVLSSPVIDKNDNIFVGCSDHRLYSLDKNGLKLWAYVLDSEILSSPALSVEGALYFGGVNGKFYSVIQDPAR